jgi:hypothetical protein
MPALLRKLARAALGVRRDPTYYLPWITRPGLGCALVLNNVEARFKPGYAEAACPLAIEQRDADGRVVRHWEVTLRDARDTVELPLVPTAGGCGFATVAGARLHSDLYVALDDGQTYSATHGRGEFLERYALRGRLLLGLAGGLLALAGRTVAAFRRDQYVYSGPDHHTRVLLLNLADVTNRVRAVVGAGGRERGARLVSLPPLGACLLDVRELVGAAATPTAMRDGGAADVWRLRLEGNAWFNLYLVGCGARDLGGPLSLMHVK